MRPEGGQLLQLIDLIISEDVAGRSAILRLSGLVRPLSILQLALLYQLLVFHLDQIVSVGGHCVQPWVLPLVHVVSSSLRARLDVVDGVSPGNVVSRIS